MRGTVPAGAQIEYERRSSRPSTSRRRVSDCPGAKANSSASSSGISKLTAAASAHSRWTAATRRRWKAGRRRVRTGGAEADAVAEAGRSGPSDLLDVLERLAAGPAAPQRLAGRGGEAGGLLGLRRAAPGAGHRGPGGRQETRGDRAAGAAPGGAMPCSASLRRPASVIQSVVHGGSRTVRISTRAYPASRSRAATSARISAMAGHPE